VEDLPYSYLIRNIIRINGKEGPFKRINITGL